MGVGYADEDPEALTRPETAEGLANFDAEQAAQNLAAVGQVPPGTPDEGAAPAAPAPEAVPTPEVAAATAPAAPAVAGAPPADTGTVSVIPAPPELTDDPAENNRRLVVYQRQLTEHAQDVTKRQLMLQENAATIGAHRGQQEANLAAKKAEEVRIATQAAAERRARAQEMVDSAVTERLESKKSLESFSWERAHDGASIAAMILGGIGAAIQNAGAAQLGQVGHAENEAVKAIDARMKRDYEAKKAKYSAAGDALLMAKYGVKDAETAHRAQMNDLDADFAARYKRVALEAEAALKQQGAPEEMLKNDAIRTSALQEAAKHEEQIHDREQTHRDSEAASAATLKLAQANLGQRQGEFKENLGERKQEFALRREDAAAARADRREAAAERAAAAEGKKKTKQDTDWASRAVKDPDTGAVINYASSPRAAPQANKDERTFYDAEKSVRELIEYQKQHEVAGAFPVGDRYNRAVLAVAATTTANASDKTTKHEEDTLKSIGVASPDAAKRTLKHIEERHAAFRRQLVSRPGEAASEMVPPPAGGGKKTGFDAPGGNRYELGADGNYHKVK